MAKVIVGKSKIDGRGIFATQDIDKGRIAFIFKGKITPYHPKTKKEALLKPDMVGVDKNLWIDPYEPFKYINHSCNPNLGTRGRVLFVALRDIKKGEELTFDYSISEDSLWEMKCHCDSKNCRKVIRGIRYLPKNVYNKYLPYIPRYFQLVYEKYQDKNNLRYV